MVKLCAGCKGIKDTQEDQATGLNYCVKCSGTTGIPSDVLGRLWLMTTIPFKVGDVVECRTAAKLYDGIGVVRGVSFDPEHSGTPVNPSFQVELTEKADERVPDFVNYTECCLRHAE